MAATPAAGPCTRFDLHLSAAAALLIALAVAVGWNVLLTLLRRKRTWAVDAVARRK